MGCQRRGVLATICILLLVTSAVAVDFNRTYLEGVVTTYLNALVAHDPGRLPTTADVRYSENTVVIPLGTGLWRLASAPGRYRHDFVEPEAGQVVTITTLTENNRPVIHVARLKVESDGRVSEIETHITRDAAGAARYEAMGSPEAAWFESVPRAQQNPRGNLLAAPNRYYGFMESHDPDDDFYSFDDDCTQLDDALPTTTQHNSTTALSPPGCASQFGTDFLGSVTRVRDRRFVVADEERQAVFAFAIVDHGGTVRRLPSVSGTSTPVSPYFDVPRTMHRAEAFRLRGNKLYRIETTLIEVPYGTRAPFEPDNDSTDKPDWAGIAPAALATHCDRTCVRDAVGAILQAMVKRDVSGLPLAPTARYTENGRPLEIGSDGLWLTLSEFDPKGVHFYAAHLNESSGGYWGVTREHDTPGVLSLRVLVSGGRITEIEAVSVRAEHKGPGDSTMTLFRPPLPVEYTGDDLGPLDPIFSQALDTVLGDDKLGLAVSSYLDGLHRHSADGVPMSPSCVRRDNGLSQTNSTCAEQLRGLGVAPNGLPRNTGDVRDRRILVADVSLGVAAVVAMVDYSPSVRGNISDTESVPGTYMVSQLFKLNGNGTIVRVESFIKWMPFGYTSAWSG
ncbi:hypothetical protein QBC47DRAFT_299058 [Echria macrotheca]|uniref:DUF8021 domain-containing protein n=1 Tax=Echria macrotheca TaxID=438768 RepID=A0AAJ0BG65_9PEZI|nr:hypothetical protein QBC47DRAFT_299058 [Echria macrotheca]